MQTFIAIITDNAPTLPDRAVLWVTEVKAPNRRAAFDAVREWRAPHRNETITLIRPECLNLLHG